jgi:drug/metabolite transporter (DMT)-like permease
MKRRWLLVLLVLIWAISWPVVKIGVAAVPPLWYACFRCLIAALCLFAFVGARNALAVPPRSDWPLVAVSAVLQLATYSALTGVALTILPAGRASVLAYSTPIWVAPLGSWWLQERMTRSGLFGVGLGVMGALAIAYPSLHASGSHQIGAYALLVAAAGAWSISIVFIRSHRVTATPLALAPWQMLIAAGLLLPVALLIEGAPPSITPSAAASLAYVGPIATAFAYWAAVESGRHFRATTMSMVLLAVPGLGILISALTIGETVGPSLIAGVLFIGAGIRLATLASLRPIAQ